MKSLFLLLSILAALAIARSEEPVPAESASDVDPMPLVALKNQRERVVRRSGFVELDIVHEIRGMPRSGLFERVEGVTDDGNGRLDYWSRKVFRAYFDYPKYYSEMLRYDRDGNLVEISREAFNGLVHTEWGDVIPASRQAGVIPAYRTRTGQPAKEQADWFWVGRYPRLFMPDQFPAALTSRDFGGGILGLEDRASTGEVRSSFRLDQGNRRLESHWTYAEGNVIEEVSFEYADASTLIPARIVWKEGSAIDTEEGTSAKQDIWVSRTCAIEEVDPEVARQFSNFVVKPDLDREFHYSDINAGRGIQVRP